MGYRVHAHLYCLSHATPSYLIAEDTRGLGVLETLGPLGVDGRGPAGGRLTEAAWRRLPRLGAPKDKRALRFWLRVGRAGHAPGRDGTRRSR